jgi:hypothetical protein
LNGTIVDNNSDLLGEYKHFRLARWFEDDVIGIVAIKITTIAIAISNTIITITNHHYYYYHCSWQG